MLSFFSCFAQPLSRFGIALSFASLSLPAAASSISHFDLVLKWDSTTFYNVALDEYGASTGGTARATAGGHYGQLSSEDDVWGLNHAFSGHNMNRMLRFRLTMVEDAGGYSPYRTEVCDFDGISCTTGTNTYYNFGQIYTSSFSVLTENGGEGYSINGGWDVGDAVSFNDFVDGSRWASGTTETGSWEASYGDAISRFTVVSAQLNPVPLPAGLALLPLGLAGLALLRRRRR